MKPLIDKAKLLQELVDHYDIEIGQQVSTVKIYSLIRAQPIEDPSIGYWYPCMDGESLICSICNCDVPLKSFHRDAFCPNCGAQMMNNNDVGGR